MCWCEKEQENTSLFDITFTDLDKEDTNNYCLRYVLLKFLKTFTKLVVDAGPVLLIELAQFLFYKIGKYQSKVMKSQE